MCTCLYLCVCICTWHFSHLQWQISSWACDPNIPYWIYLETFVQQLWRNEEAGRPDNGVLQTPMIIKDSLRTCQHTEETKTRNPQKNEVEVLISPSLKTIPLWDILVMWYKKFFLLFKSIFWFYLVQIKPSWYLSIYYLSIDIDIWSLLVWHAYTDYLFYSHWSWKNPL